MLIKYLRANLIMNSHKNLQEIDVLQVFFKKYHKASLSLDHSKIEITSCDISALLDNGKKCSRPDSIKLSGPIMHTRFQPLWLAILLDLNVRKNVELDVFDFTFLVVDLIEKSERVCQAIGLRAIKYSISDVSYFLLLLIEFRLEIVLNNCVRTIGMFTEVRHEFETSTISNGYIAINPRAASQLHVLSNRTAIVLSTLFFSKRTSLYTLLQKLLLKKEGLILADIAPATISDLKLLNHHGVISYTRTRKSLEIHGVSVFIEGLNLM